MEYLDFRRWYRLLNIEYVIDPAYLKDKPPMFVVFVHNHERDELISSMFLPEMTKVSNHFDQIDKKYCVY